MALGPISDAEVALPTLVWGGGEEDGSGKERFSLWITQELGTQQALCRMWGARCGAHPHSQRWVGSGGVQGHPLPHNMFEAEKEPGSRAAEEEATAASVPQHTDAQVSL